ncbi:MAG: SDR family oxidoreductase [Thermoplasmatota archaeon]
MDVSGKVAVVTGASKGIGLAVAEALAAKGASLLLVARGQEALEAAAEACRTAGAPRVVPLVADLTTHEGLDAVVMASVQQFGGFDILVNNAGAGTARPITQVSDEEFDREIALNLRAPYLLTQAAVKVLRRRGGGQVVNIGSGLSYFAKANWSLYAATKFGLRGFTECVRQEVAKEGIKVGLVAPGMTETPFFDHWESPPDLSQALQPADVAHAVLAMIEQGPGSDIREITVRPPHSP